MNRNGQVAGNSLNADIIAIEELLTGCRDTARVPIKHSTVMYSTDTIPRQGSLVNLSTTGICIKTAQSTMSMKDGSFLILIIGDTTNNTTVYLHGEVVWTDIKGYMGIKFINKEPEIEEKIKYYINNSDHTYSLPIKRA